MQQYLVDAGCVADAEPLALADRFADTSRGSVACSSESLLVSVDLQANPFLALELGLLVGRIGEDHCSLVGSTGPWFLLVGGQPEEATELMTRFVDDFDAVVHSSCGVPDLSPDTVEIGRAVSNLPDRCPELAFARMTERPPDTLPLVDVASFDCGSVTILRLPSIELEAGDSWAEAIGGCRPYVDLGRWLLVSTSDPEDDLLFEPRPFADIASDLGGVVREPCGTS